MKKALSLSLALTVLLGLYCNVHALDAEKGKDKQKPPAQGSLLVNYKPPFLGKPVSRIGGGTRGTGPGDLQLVALVPEHIGLSATAEPSLCWYIGKATKMMMEFTLNDPDNAKPILEKSLDASGGSGVRCENLAKDGVTLKPETQYEWFVSIVPDPGQRSKDVSSNGFVQFKTPSKDKAPKLSSLKGSSLVAAYAEEGYWYDSIRLVSELIEKTPADKTLHEMRAQLLDQAGLKELSTFDRK